MTGATLQALATVGRARGARTAQRRRGAGCVHNQNGDGGFGQFKGRPSNAQSTAYAVQGLIAAGAGRAQSRARAATSRGCSAATAASPTRRPRTRRPVWVTAQALMALEGKPLPIATAPRSKRKPGEGQATQSRPAAAAESRPPAAAEGRAAARRAAAAPWPWASELAAGEAGVGAAGGAGRHRRGGAGGGGHHRGRARGERRQAGRRREPEAGALWAGILAALGLGALLFLLHRFVLPRRADLG